MKKTFGVLLALIFLAMSVIPFVSNDVSAATQYEVSGVVKTESGVAIVGVVVAVDDHEGSASLPLVNTASEGKWTFGPVLESGVRYRINFDISGYSTFDCSVDGKPLRYLGNGWYDLGVATGDVSVDVIMVTAQNIIRGIITDGVAGVSEVEVTITDAENSNNSDTTRSNSHGQFTLLAPSSVNNFIISFEHNSYFVTWCSLDKYDDGYRVNPDIVESIFVLLSPAYGDLKVTVKNEEGVGLSEINVVLTNDTDTWTAVTERNGEYTFNGIPIGDYTITISRSDIETQTDNIEVKKTGSEKNFITVAKITTYIFDLDLPHTLMFIGIILGIAVIIVTGSYRVVIGRKAETGGVSELDDHHEED